MGGGRALVELVTNRVRAVGLDNSDAVPRVHEAEYQSAALGMHSNSTNSALPFSFDLGSRHVAEPNTWTSMLIGRNENNAGFFQSRLYLNKCFDHGSEAVFESAYGIGGDARVLCQIAHTPTQRGPGHADL